MRIFPLRSIDFSNIRRNFAAKKDSPFYEEKGNIKKGPSIHTAKKKNVKRPWSQHPAHAQANDAMRRHP